MCSAGEPSVNGPVLIASMFIRLLVVLKNSAVMSSSGEPSSEICGGSVAAGSVGVSKAPVVE